MVRGTLLTSPGFNEEFKIHTYARKLQVVSVIFQKGKPIDFYGREIADSQK